MTQIFETRKKNVFKNDDPHFTQDTDEVCDICKNMVGQARDTLQSNQTQVR